MALPKRHVLQKAGSLWPCTCSRLLEDPSKLLSTVQMPGGIPVASVAIGKAGARNAAYLAVQMLALGDAQLAQALREDRAAAAARVDEANARLQQG